MHIQNFEFKARVDNLAEKEKILLKLQPVFKGEDHQIDTYFNSPAGRLKLREGNIENALIHYERSNIAGSKLSSVMLYQYAPDNTLKQILEKILGIQVVIDKYRKIYFIDNVKFHFDVVKGLGTFIEVEAISIDEENNIEQLKSQCDYYSRMFNINEKDFVGNSYSDMVLSINK